MRRFIFSLVAMFGVSVAGAGGASNDIKIADNDTGGELVTTSGDIYIGLKSLAQSAQSDTGSITINQGANVSGKVATVSGAIQVDGAHVGGGIETARGDINIGANSQIDEGILVRALYTGVFFGTERRPRIVIGPHAQIRGTLKFKHDVDLFVSDTATIGDVDGAKVQKFSGAQP